MRIEQEPISDGIDTARRDSHIPPGPPGARPWLPSTAMPLAGVSMIGLRRYREWRHTSTHSSSDRTTSGRPTQQHESQQALVRKKSELRVRRELPTHFISLFRTPPHQMRRGRLCTCDFPQQCSSQISAETTKPTTNRPTKHIRHDKTVVTARREDNNNPLPNGKIIITSSARAKTHTRNSITSQRSTSGMLPAGRRVTSLFRDRSV